MRISVLGGGPGGYSAAFEAARLGADVTLIEKERLGGTCLNWGCIPTKTILRSARIVADTRQAADFGLLAEVASVDIDRLRTRKEDVVDELVAQVEETAKRLKVRIVHGAGFLQDPHTVVVHCHDGSEEAVESDAVILATGSVTLKLPNIDHSMDGIWTSDDAVELSEIPKNIVVIGGGVIGLEFACAYAAFGSRVTVVELEESVLPGSDKRVARTAQAKLEEMGVEFFLGDAVESVERLGEQMRSTLRSGRVVESDIVMSAVGRVPNSDGLGFSEVGIETDRAAVNVDAFFRTNVAGVYAIGDLIGGMMLAHVAEDEGIAAARNAVAVFDGQEPTATVRYECVPACLYTFPEVATVGSTRDSLKERGIDAVQAVAKFAANGKALGEGESDGFVQMVADKKSGRILGCQIVGPHAVEIVHEVALAMHLGRAVTDIAEAVHAHPTVSEVVMFAARDAAAKCDL